MYFLHLSKSSTKKKKKKKKKKKNDKLYNIKNL